MDEVAWLAAHMPVPGPRHALYTVPDDLPDVNHGPQLDADAARCVVLAAAVATGAPDVEPPRIFRADPSANLRARLPPAVLEVLRAWPGKFMVAGGCPLAAAAARDIAYGDIDVFPCGADVATADAALSLLAERCEAAGGTYRATLRAVTFSKLHTCPVQLVTHLATSPACVLNNFDLDPCRVGGVVAGGDVAVVATGAWFAAMRARAFPVVSWQWSKISPARVAKYALKGFYPVVPCFDRQRAEANCTQCFHCAHHASHKHLAGLFERREWHYVAFRLHHSGLLLVLAEVAIALALKHGESPIEAVELVSSLDRSGAATEEAEGEGAADSLAGLRWRDVTGRAVYGEHDGPAENEGQLDYYAAQLNRVVDMGRDWFVVGGDWKLQRARAEAVDAGLLGDPGSGSDAEGGDGGGAEAEEGGDVEGGGAVVEEGGGAVAGGEGGVAAGDGGGADALVVVDADEGAGDGALAAE